MSRIGKSQREISGLMKQQWQEVILAQQLYGSKPYKGTSEDFQKYLEKRRAEDAKRRPGSK